MKSSVCYSEMGETTKAQIEYTIGYNGKYRLVTHLELLNGLGLKKESDGQDHKRGMKTYYATEKAFERLKKTYTTCYMALL